jgi:hypothetical protein
MRIPHRISRINVERKKETRALNRAKVMLEARLLTTVRLRCTVLVRIGVIRLKRG